MNSILAFKVQDLDVRRPEWRQMMAQVAGYQDNESRSGWECLGTQIIRGNSPIKIVGQEYTETIDLVWILNFRKPQSSELPARINELPDQ